MSMIAYKVKKGTELFDRIWWNKNWAVEAFRKLRETGIFDTFEIEEDEVGLIGQRLVVKTNTETHEKFKSSLLSKPDKYGYHSFRKNPKDNVAKDLIAKTTQLVEPFKKKESSFLYLDVFGWGNMEKGFLDEDLAAYQVKERVSGDCGYLDQLEEITIPDYYRLQADAHERLEKKTD